MAIMEVIMDMEDGEDTVGENKDLFIKNRTQLTSVLLLCLV